MMSQILADHNYFAKSFEKVMQWTNRIDKQFYYLTQVNNY